MDAAPRKKNEILFQQVIGRPEVEQLPNSSSDQLPGSSEDVKFNSRKKKGFKPPNEKWKIIRNLERKAKRTTCLSVASRTPIQMPVVTRNDAYDVIASLKVESNRKVVNFSASNVYCEFEIDVTLTSFYESVETFQFFSFSLEYFGGSLRFHKGPKSGENGRSVLTLGCVSGQVIVFHDANDATKTLRNYFADFAVLKLTSTIDIDATIFPFQISGIVDARALIQLVDPEETEISQATLHKLVYPEGPKYVECDPIDLKSKFEEESINKISKDEEEAINKISKDEEESIKKISKGKEHIDTTCHLMQNVLSPIAFAFHVAIKAPHADYDVFPIVNDALELCWAKLGFEVAESGKTIPELWVSDEAVDSSYFELNSQKEVQRIRKARQFFLEPEAVPLDEAKANADEAAIDGLPNNKDVHEIDPRPRMTDVCKYCGTRRHKTEGCPKAATFQACQYPHRGFVYPPHSIRTCPAMHAWCKTCNVRGHEMHLHTSSLNGLEGLKKVSAGELRRDFRKFYSFGLLTSPIFLCDNSRKSYFKMGFYGPSERVLAMGDAWITGYTEPYDQTELKRLKASNEKLKNMREQLWNQYVISGLADV